MKRNPDLLRHLLLFIEDKGVPGIEPKEISIEGYPASEIMSHLNLMADAGFIVAEYSRSTTNPDRIVRTAMVFDLSWAGHEYLDLIRDPKVWKKTKELSNKAGATSIEFFIEVAKAVARDALRQTGLPI